VDVTTGTITLKGTFANADHQLWPGQYVRVTLRLTTQSNATTVPNEAVMTGQNGSYVYVVKPDRSVDTRNVVSGARVGQDMVIQSGLQPGETVVTEGQLRLAPGSHVVIRQAGGGGGGRRAGADQAPAAPDGAPAMAAQQKGDASGATGEHKGRGRGGRGGKDGRKGPPQN
jgi:multidrug efflux system membrane fusion protein